MADDSRSASSRPHRIKVSEDYWKKELDVSGQQLATAVLKGAPVVDAKQSPRWPRCPH
jgi:hypothetical protein